jgi:hypothetical protein
LFGLFGLFSLSGSKANPKKFHPQITQIFTDIKQSRKALLIHLVRNQANQRNGFSV